MTGMSLESFEWFKFVVEDLIRRKKKRFTIEV